MREFTNCSEKIDNFVKEKIETVTNEIRKSLPGLKSIFLVGGYGRKEGGIEIIKGKPKLINDFDFYAITEKQIADEELKELGVKCAHLIGGGGLEYPDFFIENYDFDRFFHVDIRNVTPKRLKKSPPLIRYFELKYSSRLLFGEDLTKQIPSIEAEDLPPAEGIRLLMNRMMALFLSFKSEFFFKKLVEEERRALNYYIAKAYLSCVEALLVTSGDFQATYKGRAKVFSKIYRKKFPLLNEKFPDLPEKALFFTEYKISPDFRKVDSLKEWFQCRERMGGVFQYCLGELLKKKIPNNWVEVSEITCKNLDFKYFEPYFSFFLKPYHLDHTLIRKLLVLTLKFYLSLRYFSNLKKETKKNYWGFLVFEDPGIKILAATPLVLYSLDQNGQVKKSLLNQAYQVLKTIYPITKNNDEWEDLKSNYLKAYRLYFLQRFI